MLFRVVSSGGGVLVFLAPEDLGLADVGTLGSGTSAGVFAEADRSDGANIESTVEWFEAFSTWEIEGCLGATDFGGCLGSFGQPERPWHRSQILQSEAVVSPKYWRIVFWRQVLVRA